MAVDLFAKIDRSKVESLPFLKGNFPFGYVDTAYINRLGIAYEIGADDFRKMQSLFNGKQEKTIVKGDRVFVLSGCKIPQFKIKEFCRGIGAIMVNDIEDATIFVGNNRVHQSHQTYEAEPLNSLAMILDCSYLESDGPGNLLLDEVTKDYYPDPTQIKYGRFTKLSSSRAQDCHTSSVRHMYCITPYTGRVVHAILSKGIVTINEDCLLKQLPAPVVLDKHLCDQVMRMMASTDEENHKVAHEILANCDYSNSELYLYKLAKFRYSQLSRSRYKNVRLFIKESDIVRLYGLDEEDFLKELMEKNKLTKEAVEELMPIIAKTIDDTLKANRSSVFNIKLELRPELAAVLGDHNYNTELGLLPLNMKP